jgi:hypothetical protein
MEHDHNCEIPGWRCYGNGPIVLYRDLEEDFWIRVNYCPFCGLKIESEDG